MNRAPAAAPPGRIAFVGSGPGDPGLLTVRARDALAAAPLVAAQLRRAILTGLAEFGIWAADTTPASTSPGMLSVEECIPHAASTSPKAGHGAHRVPRPLWPWRR